MLYHIENPADLHAQIRTSKIYVNVPMVKRSSGLSFNARLLYGYLIFKLRDEKPVNILDIASGTGLDRDTVPLIIKELGSLVQGEPRQGFVAIKPQNPEWFTFGTDLEWHSGIFKYRHYLLTKNPKQKSPKGVRPTAMNNAVYWLLHSLSDDEGVIPNPHPARFSSMLGIKTDTARSSLDSLSQLKLIKVDDESARILPLPDNALSWWQDRKTATSKQTSTSKTKPQTTESTEPPEPIKEKEPTVKKAPTEPNRTFSLSKSLGIELVPSGQESDSYIPEYLDKIARTMVDDGFTEKDVIEVWENLAERLKSARAMISFIMYQWSPLYEEACTIHRKKGKSSNCKGLIANNAPIAIRNAKKAAIQECMSDRAKGENPSDWTVLRD